MCTFWRTERCDSEQEQLNFQQCNGPDGASDCGRCRTMWLFARLMLVNVGKIQHKSTLHSATTAFKINGEINGEEKSVEKIIETSVDV